MYSKQHYQTTKNFFNRASVEKKGFYDAPNKDYLKHSVWQKKVRNYVKEFLSHCIINGDRVIDLGCGNGDFTLELAEQFSDSTFVGVDFADKAINLARKSNQENVQFEQGDVTKNLSRGGDVVICMNTLHHIHQEDTKKVMKNVTKLAKREIILEIKDEDCFYNKFFRGSNLIKVFPMNRKNLETQLAEEGFTLIREKHLFWLRLLSPISVLHFTRKK